MRYEYLCLYMVVVTISLIVIYCFQQLNQDQAWWVIRILFILYFHILLFFKEKKDLANLLDQIFSCFC